MIEANLPIYLASKSPRRRKLLNQINLNFKSFTVDLEEKIIPGEKPSTSVKRLSKEKLEIARQKVNHGIIITADTIVVLNRKVIGKPKDKKEAKRFLTKLSGKVHSVYTGFSIYNSENKTLLTDYEKTFVEFRKLNEKEIDDYINREALWTKQVRMVYRMILVPYLLRKLMAVITMWLVYH